MASSFEYVRCFCQGNKATFEGNKWLGFIPQAEPDAQEALNSCPDIQDYLNEKGKEGWELVGVAGAVSNNGVLMESLYLKRAL